MKLSIDRERNAAMRAMVLNGAHQPLVLVEREMPVPGAHEVLVEVAACAVCRTDLHVVDGELPGPKLPLIPGHEVVGRVVAVGKDAERFRIGDRVGIPWLAETCGTCRYCGSGRENLCDRPIFTGYTRDGGFATHVTANEDYCFALPERYSDTSAAPLLCAGLIGHRALRATAQAERLGIYGFGAAAHIVAQIARHEGRSVYAFTRPGDRAAQQFAQSLGCDWAGGSDESPPVRLDGTIIFAPVGGLVPVALRAVAKGGTLVLASIHMSDIPAMPYDLLWGERVVRSIANLTRADGEEFMALSARVPIETAVTPMPLTDANMALQDLRDGRLTGAAVLVP